MASFIQSAWQFLITHFSDFQLACLGTFLLHEGVFFLSGLPFVWLERTGWLGKYKIQSIMLAFMQEKNNSPAAQEKCIIRLMLYHFCVNLPVMIISYPMFKYMGMRSSLPLPSWYLKNYFNRVIVSIHLSYMENHFNPNNLLLHFGRFYILLGTQDIAHKMVVQTCTQYATPFGLNSEYAHPAEILFLGFATIVGPALTGPHLVTLWIWMIVRVLETIEAHCGYHFPWSLSNFFPLYGGADFHDYHHRLLYTKSGNYSSTFTYMDWIFGTDIGYRKLKASKRAEVEYSREQKKH
ncbi:Methylsterol monooxygenase 2-2, partial [Mucuna pruriens]